MNSVQNLPGEHFHQRKINTSSEHWEFTCLPTAVMGHLMGSQEDSGAGGVERGEDPHGGLLEDTLGPKRVGDHAGQEFGLKCKVALNKV